MEYTDVLDNSKNTERGLLYDLILELREDIKAAAEYGEAVESYIAEDSEHGIETYLNKFDENKRLEVLNYILIYQSYSSIQFGENLVYGENETEEGKNLTLYDALTLPTSEELIATPESERKYGELCLDQYIVEILRKSMTTGQLKLAQLRGLDTVISYAFSGCGDDRLADIQSKLTSAKDQLNGIESISLYEGVDKSLLDDYKDVAFTGSAIEEIDKGGSISLAAKTYQKAEHMKNVSKILAIVGGSCVVAGSIMMITGKLMIDAYEAAYNVAAQLLEKQGAEYITNCTVRATMSAFDKGLAYAGQVIANWIGPILFIVAIIVLIAALAVYLARPKEIPNITYTKIPRALVHQVEDLNNKYTYNYYAVKLIDAVDNKDDYMNVYGDLNGKGGKVEWLVLYYTKDTRVGKPLSGNAKFSIGAENTNLNYQNNYIPVHGFDLETATNLNNLNFGSGIKGIYMYMEQVTETPLTGSLFSGNQVATSISCALGGAVIAFLATFFSMRKKKKGE